MIAEVAEEHIASAPSPAAARRSELRTSPSCRPHLHDSSFPSFAALLRHPRVRVPAHFQTLQGVKFVLRRGMSDPQAGKAWRRASQTHLPLGRGVDSATRLGKRATFHATHLRHQRLFCDTQTHTQTEILGYVIRTHPVRACTPTRSSKPHPRAPPPDPRLAPGPVFATSGGVKREISLIPAEVQIDQQFLSTSIRT